MTVQSAVVIGAGTMGRGIAQWLAQMGVKVELCDSFPEILPKAEASINASWDKLQSKGKFTADQVGGFKSNLKFIEAITDSNKSTDLLIEAVPEKLDIKDQVFETCHQHFEAKTMFASNTSSISIDKLCRNLSQDRKERFFGLHFFNPATIMKLVELIPGNQTEFEIVADVQAQFEAWGKQIAICRNFPGFIVNRVARNFYGEALRIAQYENEEKIAEIDHILREVGGFRMGPFELMDLIGIDVNLSVTESVWDAYCMEPRFAPHPLQRRKVEANQLGRKTGQGFYDYREGGVQ
jgi:3-hydroxybutyryl-CoA dehydrogenase